MKKYLSWLFLLITAFAFSQTKPTYNIGVLADNRSPKLSPLFDQLKNEVKAVVGEDASIVFPEGSLLFSSFDLQMAQENYNRLINDNNVDLILAFGVVNNQIISRQTTHAKPTILFGAVNRGFQ